MWRIRPKALNELGVMASTRAFAVVGVFASLAQFTGFVPGLSTAISQYWAQSLLSVALLAAFTGAYRLFQPAQVKFRARGTNLEIEVKVGDLFAEPHNIAVPVNDFFDTELGTPVSPNSVHGQFVSRVFPNDPLGARKQIDDALGSKTPLEQLARAKGAGRRFQVGETAIVPNRGHHFVLVALSETDAATCEAHASPMQLVCTLVALWNQTRACCNHEPISVPLIGAGSSRTGLSKVALLDFLLATAIRAHMEKPITKKLSVILRSDDLNDIDLFDVQRRYG